MSYASLADAQLVNASITQAMLDTATLYLDGRYKWAGVLADTAQIGNWPRLSACGGTLQDANGRDLVGVPDAIKSAEIALAGLVEGGATLLPSTVAVATSASSTAGGELIEKTVASGDERVTKRWSSSSSETTSAAVSDFDESGLPIIVSIDIMLKSITGIGDGFSGSNFMFNRA